MPLQTAKDLIIQENHNASRVTATFIEAPAQIKQIRSLYQDNPPEALKVLNETINTLSSLRNYSNNPSVLHIKNALDEARPLVKLLVAEIEKTGTTEKPDNIKETGYYDDKTPITVSILAEQISVGLDLTREYADGVTDNVDKLSKMVTVLANMNSLHEKKIQAIATILESYMICLLIAVKQEDLRQKTVGQGYWTPGLGRK